MLAEAFHVLRIYRKLMTLHIRASLEYEADFWIGIVGTGLTHLAGFVFVWAFFQNAPSIKGWGLWDTAFLYGLSVLPRGCAELFSDGVWNVRMMINRGELDRLLVRPLSPLIQMVTSLSSIHGLGNVLVGVLILWRAAHELHLDWNLGKLGLLLLTIINAVFVITAISLMTNCIGFWEPATTGSFPNTIYQFLEFTKFPLTVYDRFVQVLLTWVLPFAFVSYYPGLILLGKPGVNAWLGYITPLAGLLTVLIAGLVWRVGLARYQGTGS